MQELEETPEEWIITLEVPPGYREGTRLDVYLTRFLPNASRAKVQSGLKEGRVLINGLVIDKSSYRVQAGDRIECRLRRPPPVQALPEDIPLDIIYEDEYLIVLNKPAGMVVHPAYANLTGTLVNALLHHVGAHGLALEEMDELEEDEVGLSTVNAAPGYVGDLSIRPGIVHRLDKDTSGIMVVAKDDVCHRRLARQFEERTINRRYLALVWGAPVPSDGRIEGDIARDPRDRKRMAVAPPGKGKHAVTHYRILERFACASLLECKLETGRTHQIRVHMKYIGHPILGDATYDGQAIHRGAQTQKRKAFFNNLFQAMPRQALHAYTLVFVHPHTEETMHFEMAPPEDMRYVLQRLRDVEPENLAAAQ